MPAFAALLVVLALGLADAARAEPDALGPAPRDADGRFANEAGELSNGRFCTRFPFFLSRFAGPFRARREDALLRAARQRGAAAREGRRGP